MQLKWMNVGLLPVHCSVLPKNIHFPLMYIYSRLIIFVGALSSSSLSLLLSCVLPRHFGNHRCITTTNSATATATIITNHWMRTPTIGMTATESNDDNTDINHDKTIESAPPPPSNIPNSDEDDDETTRSLRDAYAYHHYASMGVDLTPGHLISSALSQNDQQQHALSQNDQQQHVFTVQRSVRDIDENRRRKYLYTIPFTTTTTATTTTSTTTTLLPILPIPPQELHAHELFRLPSPSGNYMAIFRNDPGVTTTTTTTPKSVVLEVWETHTGMSLTRRIALNPTGNRRRRHGSLLCDPNGAFVIPAWNAAETCLVYTAEQTVPSTTSFFDTPYSQPQSPKSNHHHNDDIGPPTKVVGQQHVLGIGKVEHYGEKYHQHLLHHSMYCVHIGTGHVGRVTNVPITHPDSPMTWGQVQFAPPHYHGNNTGVEEESIVYTGWGDAPSDHPLEETNATKTYTKRLGFIYCQQRPCQLYHSKVTHLLERLSSLEYDDDDNLGHDDGDRMDPPCVTLTHDMKLAHSPRFYYNNSVTQDSDAMNLVFLTSRQGFDTHAGCWALGTMSVSHIFDLYNPRSDDSHASTDPVSSKRLVVDEVWAPSITTSSSSETNPDHDDTVARLSFPGLFLQQLPQSCFISSEYLLATTQWGSCQKVVRVSLKSGTVRLISIQNEHPYSSDELLCCNHVGAVVSTKTPNQPAKVHFIAADQLQTVEQAVTADTPDHGPSMSVASTVIGTFSPMASSKIALTGKQLKQVLPFLVNNFDFDIRSIPVTTNVDGDNCHHQIQSILLLPTTKTKHDESSNEMLPPLIVIPHGGPHSASITNFVVSYAYLCGYGRYAILLVNYRGSTGFGQASIRSLPTNIGSQDVQDVIDATNDIYKSGLVDANRIGICGGSHGGFLTAHLTGQYPTMFKAAVMRNPVVNLPSMVTSTDIPDWCYVEACGSYNFDTYRPPNLEEIQTFYKVSPIQYIQKVQTPTLIALGLKDLRVPPSQGMEWYYSLRGRLLSPPPPTKLLLYENDDHAIDGVASEADHWVHIKQWFDQYL